MENKKTYKITTGWAVSIIAGAMLTGLVTGAFSVVGILNSDHFTVIALDSKVKEIETTMVRKDVHELQLQVIDQKVDTLLRHFNLVIDMGDNK